MTPEEKALYFVEWQKNKKSLIASLKTKSRDELVELLLMRTFEFEILESSYEELEDREDMSEDILYQEFKKKKKFAGVRAKANESRQNGAQAQEANIAKALDDLFKNGMGWQMRTKAIANFLIDNKLSPYTYGTTLNKMKMILPAIKRKYKSDQKNT